MRGERLQELRVDRGLSQEALARELHVNKHSISSYERGKSEPSDALKIRMASFFGVSLDYLLGATEDPAPKEGGIRFLRLPENFPMEALDSLKLFMHFLVERYDMKPKEKETNRVC